MPFRMNPGKGLVVNSMPLVRLGRSYQDKGMLFLDVSGSTAKIVVGWSDSVVAVVVPAVGTGVGFLFAIGA